MASLSHKSHQSLDDPLYLLSLTRPNAPSNLKPIPYRFPAKSLPNTDTGGQIETAVLQCQWRFNPSNEWLWRFRSLYCRHARSNPTHGLRQPAQRVNQTTGGLLACLLSQAVHSCRLSSHEPAHKSAATAAQGWLPWRKRERKTEMKM